MQAPTGFSVTVAAKPAISAIFFGGETALGQRPADVGGQPGMLGRKLVARQLPLRA